MRNEQTPAAARVVMLGGSNLARGVSSAIEAARLAVGRPLEVLLAMGHGRSYGVRSTVLGRSLPGILECGLWEALARRKAGRTYALLTDIGNDVMYGVPQETISEWVGACLQRLADAGAVTAMTPLPMASIESLGPWRYRLAKTILFPGRRMTLAEALDRARRLQGMLRELGQARGVSLVEHRADWYGFDPIHIRWSLLPEAWASMMAPWRDGGAGPGTRPSWSIRRWLALKVLRPQRWWLAGVPLGSPQPAGVLPDGSSIGLY